MNQLAQATRQLAQQMAWLEQIAYRYWKPQTNTTPTKTNPAHPPLALETTAWDLLQACTMILEDIWHESGHITSHNWQTLAQNIINDADYITTLTHSHEWTQILQQTTKKAQQTTQTEPDLDPQGVLVKTPQQTADWLATHYQISCSGKQTHQWMQRGQIHAKKLGDHYWAISTSSLHQFGHKHQPK